MLHFQFGVHVQSIVYAAVRVWATLSGVHVSIAAISIELLSTAKFHVTLQNWQNCPLLCTTLPDCDKMNGRREKAGRWSLVKQERTFSQAWALYAFNRLALASTAKMANARIKFISSKNQFPDNPRSSNEDIPATYIPSYAQQSWLLVRSILWQNISI